METDEVLIISGIRNGITIGSPVGMMIKNKDFDNWKNKNIPVFCPRPGHADLAGMQKFGFKEARKVIERASARETVAKVAAGAVFKCFLKTIGIEIAGHVTQIGKVRLVKPYTFKQIKNVFVADPGTRCVDLNTAKKMQQEISFAREKKDTLGGVLEVCAVNIPAGLGSYSGFSERMDSQLAGALMGIPSVKAVEIGNGIQNSANFGSKVHDKISFSKNKGFFRNTNNAGGIEGGVTNGMPVIVRLYLKPIPTLYKPLETVNVITKKTTKAAIERSDVCVVPRAGVVAESMMAFIIAKNIIKKFGGDSIGDLKNAYKYYLKRLSNN